MENEMEAGIIDPKGDYIPEASLCSLSGSLVIFC